MGHSVLEGYLVKICPFFLNFDKSVLKSGGLWRLKFFTIFLISLSTTRRHCVLDHRRPTTRGPPGGLGAQVLKSGRLLRLIFCLPDIGGPPPEAPWVARGPMGGQGPRLSKETILVEIFYFFLLYAML